jgi:spermidine synthase
MKKGEALSLLIAVSVIATCGLIYELVAGALASYLLGDSITQFSTIIGTYLFAMGVGSYCSKYFETELLDKFILIEYLVGIIGGFSAMILFIMFNEAAAFGIVLYSIVFITGTLVGLEIPLLIHILKNKIEFKNLIARVFSFDYLGALIASLIFPLFFIPKLGLLKTALFFGILNVSTGIVITFFLEAQVKKAKSLKFIGFVCLLLLISGFLFGDRILATSESKNYTGRIIYASSSPYQRIVITRQNDEVRLFLNNNLQFSTRDEYRYHEALVHPVMQRAKNIKHVLILGGGDGMAAREVLKYDAVAKIDLVDLDGKVTKLFSQHPLLKKLNNESLLSSKLTVINTDAFSWIKNVKSQYDAVIIDFPDPSNYSLGKLYSNTFYGYLKKVMKDSAIAVIQSTSPYVAKKSFWCINNTINNSGLNTLPYYNNVPSFGMWGYTLATLQNEIPVFRNLPKDLKFFTDSSLITMQQFAPDLIPKETIEINRLNNQSLVQYFEKEWSLYLHN